MITVLYFMLLPIQNIGRVFLVGLYKLNLFAGTLHNKEYVIRAMYYVSYYVEIYHGDKI